MSYEKIYIFFDTNSLEDYTQREVTKGDRRYFLPLFKFKFPDYYYNIVNFIKDNGLQKKVEIMIPEIVWMELEKHMLQQYEVDKQNLIKQIQEYKSIFSDLVDISYEFRQDDYPKYLSLLMSELKEDPRVSAKIIPCPTDDKCISKIIKNAMYTEPPFAKAHKNTKEYSDAGFKDALIAETVLMQKDETALLIFVSNDNDFKTVFHDVKNITVCDEVDGRKKFETIKTLISEQFLQKEEIIKKEISSNDYLLQELIAQTGLDTNLDYKFNNFESINEQIDEEDTEPSNIWDIIFTMYVGETLYKFQIEYDGNAHGIETGEIIDD